VTSVGRDGEAWDALDERMAKPPIRLRAGSLVATTDALLHASGVAHERIVETGLRTPLGRVVIARMEADGEVEVAGPGSARDVRSVADAMLALGAAQVLVDGALDRRAGASPAVADAVVLCTGAVLHRELGEVVARTRTAAELLMLPLAPAGGAHPAVAVDPRLALDGSDADVAALLRAHPGADTLALPGALVEPFAERVLRATRGRPLTLVVADGTRVFLTRRSREWYARQGIAIAVNPVAPLSHRLDSEELRCALAEAVPGVPVLDVLEPRYAQACQPLNRVV
jgi:hypothetical protein